MARKGSKINRSRRKLATKSRKRTDNGSQRSKLYLAEAQRLTRTGHWVLTASSQLSVWSPELFRIFDFDPVAQKPSLFALLGRVHPDDRPDVEKKITAYCSVEKALSTITGLCFQTGQSSTFTVCSIPSLVVLVRQPKSLLQLPTSPIVSGQKPSSSAVKLI
jgi:hypothetical protein